jgi:hypothetical protein
MCFRRSAQCGDRLVSPPLPTWAHALYAALDPAITETRSFQKKISDDRKGNQPLCWPLFRVRTWLCYKDDYARNFKHQIPLHQLLRSCPFVSLYRAISYLSLLDIVPSHSRSPRTIILISVSLFASVLHPHPIITISAYPSRLLCLRSFLLLHDHHA